VESLITRHIDSVARLEVLLLLHERKGISVSADDVTSKLRIDATWARAQLDELCARGLAECAAERYRLVEGPPNVVASIDDLAQAFVDRRVAVITAIYSRPQDPIRDFSNAFRFRKPSGGDRGGERGS
jgi:hypothetical protein